MDPAQLLGHLDGLALKDWEVVFIPFDGRAYKLGSDQKLAFFTELPTTKETTPNLLKRQLTADETF
jgi:hypothetical protein